MKKLLFILSLLPLLSIGQGIGTRVNGITGALEQYVQNSPGNSPSNSRLVTSLKDSTWHLLNSDSVIIHSVRNTLNHGTPSNIIWSLSNGALHTSPINLIPVTSAQIADLSTFSTTNLSEGTNLYYTAGRFNSAFSAKSTTDLSEGTNQYFTNARARTALSGSTGISYNNSTGVIANSAPDQTVTITGGGAGGTYPNFTITPVGNNNASGYGTGTAYTLTTSSAKIDFGTTDPVVTLLFPMSLSTTVD
jgi:hypothetical protein